MTASASAAVVAMMLLRGAVRVVVLVVSTGEPEKRTDQAKESKLRLHENGFETI